jgi:hypothetical protein
MSGMAPSRPQYRHILFAVAFGTIVASTGVAFTVEARPSHTPWITAASAFDENATESTGLLLSGAALIGLAATIRKIAG